MKSKYLLFVLVCAVCMQCDGQSKTGSQVKSSSAALKNRADSLGYALGNNLGEFLKANGVTDITKDLNTEMMIKAIKDATGNQKPAMTREQCSSAINSFVMVKRTESVAKNKAAGQKFLEENKKKPGVVTLPSGLQYQVIKEGTGPKPALTDKVKTHYHGTLIDGTVFDSSVDRGQPISFAVNGVIPGWTEALQLMREGDKWVLYIPYNLAYGERGAGNDIPPYATLIFEVELLNVK